MQSRREGGAVVWGNSDESIFWDMLELFSPTLGLFRRERVWLAEMRGGMCNWEVDFIH